MRKAVAVVWLTVLLVFAAARCATAQPAVSEQDLPTPAPEPELVEPGPFEESPQATVSTQGPGYYEGAPFEECPHCQGAACYGHAGPCGLDCSCHRLHEFTSRSSATHGRAVGFGEPLRGTSWLNRPYGSSVDFGAFLMTNRPATGVRAGNDLFVSVQTGWDWDHYWGTQLRMGWTSPTLDNPQRGGDTSDNLFLADASLMYYPWGDSRVRPYWRLGAGLTDLEFTNVNGARQHEFLYTIPFGVGVKHMAKRWLVWRAELVDNLAIGSNEAKTMNNLTLTFGVEMRWGGAPDDYWAWRPRGYVW